MEFVENPLRRGSFVGAGGEVNRERTLRLLASQTQPRGKLGFLLAQIRWLTLGAFHGGADDEGRTPTRALDTALHQLSRASPPKPNSPVLKFWPPQSPTWSANARRERRRNRKAVGGTGSSPAAFRRRFTARSRMRIWSRTGA